MRKKEMQNSIYCLTDVFKHFQLIFENSQNFWRKHSRISCG